MRCLFPVPPGWEAPEREAVPTQHRSAPVHTRIERSDDGRASRGRQPAEPVRKKRIEADLELEF